MNEILEWEIGHEEILAHYIFDRHFKRKIPSESNLITKDIFLPNRGGVSLQRTRYCAENLCKRLAKQITGRNFLGFYIFSKNVFDEVKEEFIKTSRSDFEAIIEASPLKEDNTLYPHQSLITLNSRGNIAHADLKYINPAPEEGETPKTAMRSFSRKLSKKCSLLLDQQPDAIEYNGAGFDTY